MEQLQLQLAASCRGLKKFFETALKKPVELVMTDNSTRMLSFRAVGSTIAMRLSRVFLSAPVEVLVEAATFVARRKGPTPALNRFLRLASPGEARPRKAPVRHRGRHHDLKEAYDRVNGEYFGGAVKASITWSRRQSGKVRRRTLGSYCPRSTTVRINPVLDNASVPSLFVDYIVYHEMLHAVVAIGEKRGRRVVHSREFRKKERAFRGYEEALAWERANRAIL